MPPCPSLPAWAWWGVSHGAEWPRRPTPNRNVLGRNIHSAAVGAAQPVAGSFQVTSGFSSDEAKLLGWGRGFTNVPQFFSIVCKKPSK